VILSTCNRTEIYTLADSPGRASNHILRLISDFHGLDANIFDGHSYSLEGANSARNLFRVSSGLDSMILGESQILGQVRTALSAAAYARTDDPEPMSGGTAEGCREEISPDTCVVEMSRTITDSTKANSDGAGGGT
jgi:hypothetical protein